MSQTKDKLLDPEVVPLAKPRRFSASEKLRIVEEADKCTEAGQIGALLRREGIYSSHLTRWRKARDNGKLTALQAQKRGPKTSSDKALQKRVEELERENERLQARLTQAETIIDVQKKLSQLLGLNTEEKVRNGNK